MILRFFSRLVFGLSKLSVKLKPNFLNWDLIKLNDPIRTSENPNKKFKVYVKDPSSGNVKVVRFGDPNLSIKRDDPDRRKSFRARHNCDNPGPITKPRYWSCHQWRSGAKVDN